MSDHPTPEGIMQLGLGFWGSKAFLTAVELDLFTRLAKEPGDADALTKRLGLHGRGARDFYDALVAMGMLERDDQGVYRNTPETGLFLDRTKPGYVGGMLEMCNVRLYEFWGSLKTALKTGEPQNESKVGEDVFGKIYADPDRLRVFLQAMTGISMGAARSLAANGLWKEYTTAVDIGAAQGCVPVEVARANDHISGGGFDLPPVRPVFEDYVASFKLQDRLKFHDGDFFKQDLPSADVLVMGHILHDWDLEQKKTLLQKAHKALPDGGSLVVYETLIDDDRRKNVLGLLMSLNMLIETQGGFDYTGADCRKWMKEIGFRESRVEHLAGPDSMVVGVK